MTRRSAWTRRAAAGAWCAVLTAGCTAGPGPAPGRSAAVPTGSATRPPASARPAVTPGPVAPLTGLAVPAAVAQRPAVAVAVAGQDPAGLGVADLVFEEMTHPVRYLAVFQSAEAASVGPVTGTRPMDGQALSVLHPLIGYAGGTGSFVSVLDATKVVDAGYAGHPSLYAAGPGGLTVSTAALAASGGSDGPPPGLFSFRVPGVSLASARETHPTSVRVRVPGQAVQQWSFDSRAGRWVETAGGPRVSVANLVVQIVPYKTVYLSRRHGLTAQSARVIGTGPVTVVSGSAPGRGGGTAAAGIWRKPGLPAVTNYLDVTGTPMSFVPGPTWIVLAPPGTLITQAGGDVR